MTSRYSIHSAMIAAAVLLAARGPVLAEDWTYEQARKYLPDCSEGLTGLLGPFSSLSYSPSLEPRGTSTLGLLGYACVGPNIGGALHLC